MESTLNGIECDVAAVADAAECAAQQALAWQVQRPSVQIHLNCAMQALGIMEKHLAQHIQIEGGTQHTVYIDVPSIDIAPSGETADTLSAEIDRMDCCWKQALAVILKLALASASALVC